MFCCKLQNSKAICFYCSNLVVANNFIASVRNKSQANDNSLTYKSIGAIYCKYLHQTALLTLFYTNITNNIQIYDYNVNNAEYNQKKGSSRFYDVRSKHICRKAIPRKHKKFSKQSTIKL